MKIRIDVTPLTFTFSTNRATIPIDTYLYVVVRDGKVMPSAIGEDDGSRGLPDAYRVDLFKSNGSLPEIIHKAELLTCFVQYGVMKAQYESTKFLAFRPTVVFSGINSLDSIFHGYQKMVLKQATLDANAWRVEFVDQ